MEATRTRDLSRAERGGDEIEEPSSRRLPALVGGPGEQVGCAVKLPTIPFGERNPRSGWISELLQLPAAGDARVPHDR